MLSRVVPGKSATISRGSPTSALTSVDLPTLGLPTTATRRPLSTASSSDAGNLASTWPNNSSTPCPVRAEITKGAPNASSKYSAAIVAPSSPSALFTTTNTGLSPLRRLAPIAMSWWVKPSRASTIKTTASASSRAWSTCCLTALLSSPASSDSPPVSTARTFCEPRQTSPYNLSRVTPG